jgi:glycosyltransferase involved in cell wall biosynthesis
VVVPPGDVRALAAALRDLLAAPDHAAALGRRARERCQARYSFASARADLFPLIEGVVGRGARR